MHFLGSFEEAYQMVLKAEEKCKWSSYRKHESFKNVKDKTKKVGASSSERPNPQQGGGTKEQERELQAFSRVSDVAKKGIDHTNVQRRKLSYS